MDNLELIDLILKDLEPFHIKGRKTVRVEKLERYLMEIKSELASEGSVDQERHSQIGRDFQLAEYQAQNEANLAHYRAINEAMLAKFRATTSAGQAALKASIMINGGAAVALLAFIGGVYTSSPAICAGLAQSMLLFSIGVLFSAIAAGLTYCASYYGSEKTMKRFLVFNIGAIIATVISYGLFLSGCIAAFVAFLPIE